MKKITIPNDIIQTEDGPIVNERFGVKYYRVDPNQSFAISLFTRAVTNLYLNNRKRFKSIKPYSLVICAKHFDDYLIISGTSYKKQLTVSVQYYQILIGYIGSEIPTSYPLTLYGSEIASIHLSLQPSNKPNTICLNRFILKDNKLIITYKQMKDIASIDKNICILLLHNHEINSIILTEKAYKYCKALIEVYKNEYNI